MLNFCTLFNINYLAKGLALHNSLVKTCPQFHLYIFVFDDISQEILQKKNLINATIISLQQFENDELLAIKNDRTTAEYCYTCTPFTIKYCFENFNIDNCTYVDADIYFYDNPAALITNMGDNAVLITPHNYHNLYDQSAVSGIYCVQFVAFKNSAEGLKVLNWWASACIKWCYARYEDGKMGDQKYLDSWPYMFDGVQICRSPGAGLAPWNALSFPLSFKDTALALESGPLYFYHFHGLQYLSNDTWCLGHYQLPENVVENIYKPYIKQLLATARDIANSYPQVDVSNTIDIKIFDDISLKYKIGIYIIDIKKSFRRFIADLFFIDRRRHYKKNYIKLH